MGTVVVFVQYHIRTFPRGDVSGLKLLFLTENIKESRICVLFRKKNDIEIRRTVLKLQKSKTLWAQKHQRTEAANLR